MNAKAWVMSALLGMAAGAVVADDGMDAHYYLWVDGLTASYTGYGLERKLERINGVTGVRMDLDRGLVAVDVDERTVLDPDELDRAVDAAGFSLRDA